MVKGQRARSGWGKGWEGLGFRDGGKENRQTGRQMKKEEKKIKS